MKAGSAGGGKGAGAPSSLPSLAAAWPGAWGLGPVAQLLSAAPTWKRGSCLTGLCGSPAVTACDTLSTA